ncbi:DegV family protein [Clostridium gasigenes]|uniref:DegV family protein n=1 Tax=Clostridium gasigenes TaxID=94869 RepID=A0A7X0SE08_9CLOT|nr:DegV family protein [Clostridium gasigenes]MBB6715780.1 DegV family protein [Clostridium gasigenes]MBU3137504.1 DegV family protein [Clostridium gasigenes]
MQKIAIVTDSACDLTLETMKENDIHLSPLRIIYSHGEFEDKINITSEEVYNSLETEIPTTSLPSPKTCERVLSKIEAAGYTHVIAISVSKALSGTFNAFRLALEGHPNLTSTIFDSKIIGYCQGVIVLEASKMVQAGKSYEEILEYLPKARENVVGYYTLNTLEYLIKGGRIGKLAGAIGQFLHLKPIITMDNTGVYCSIAKVRGRKQSLSKLHEIIKEHLTEGKCKLWVLQGDALEEGTKFMENLRNLHNVVSVELTLVGAMSAAHSGRGMIGIAIQRVD